MMPQPTSSGPALNQFPGEVVLAHALVQHVEQHRPYRHERSDDREHGEMLPLPRQVVPEEGQEAERSETRTPG